MKYFYLVIFVFPHFLLSQNHDYTWVFGYDSNLGLPNIEGVIGDFNLTPPSFDYETLYLSIRPGSTSIADTLGNLLFYTNGCSIADATHNIMENGDSLNLGPVHEEQCEFGYPSGTQSAIILPAPGNHNIYYLFHKHINYVYEPDFDIISDTLFATIIDVSHNNGLGEVVEKNTPIITERMTYGQVSAVKHANGEDWWIITAGDQTNTYYKLLLQNHGIQELTTQDIGLASSVIGAGGGQSVFSPNGNYYVRYSEEDGIYLFNFDRFSGELDNFKHITIGEEAFSDGVAISPNSRFLYITTDLHLYQYDLMAEDIESSKIVVDSFDGFQSPFPTTFNKAQLAPDCKIYINTFATVDVLHVIHNPDEPGIACNFEQHAIQLPFNHFRSLPNFPNYRLGPLIEGEEPAPPCELAVDIEEPQEIGTNQKVIALFPNPTSGELNVELQEVILEEAILRIYNQTGELIRTYNLKAGQQKFQFSLQDLPAGFYFYRLETIGNNDIQFTGKLVKM